MELVDILQNKPVQINFQINGTSNETDQKINVTKYTVPVDQDGLLAIHLYWAGKGSSGYIPYYNGPLISAISVTPGIMFFPLTTWSYLLCIEK